MEQNHEQNTGRSMGKTILPICVLLIAALALWFFLYEQPHQAALTEFRSAAASYDETYRNYYAAVDACNQKVLTWQEGVPGLESDCKSLEQILESGEPVRSKDAEAARMLLTEAETILENVPMSEPVIAAQTWDSQNLNTEELTAKRTEILNETERISREIPQLKERADQISVPDFKALAKRFDDTEKMLQDSIVLRQKIGISLDDFEDEIRIYDPFENLIVTFEGTDPDGRVRIDKKSTVGVDREYAFHVDSNSGLKNGDTVEVTVEFGDSMESFNQNLAAQYKTVISEWAKEYTVEGLPFSLTEMSQIDAMTLDVIKQRAVDTITAQAEQKEDLVKVDKISLIGHCFLNRKSPTNLLDSTRNYLFLVYSVKCTIDLTPDGNNYKNTVNYVTSVRFSNLLGMPDGKTALSLESATLPSTSITVNTGVPTVLLFLPRTFQFAGYQDTDTLFYNEVAPLLDKFYCDANISRTGEAVPVTQ